MTIKNRIQHFIKTHRIVVGTVGAIVAFAVAAVYFVVIPAEASTAGFVSSFILTYGHSLCWVLLGIASIGWVAEPNRTWPKAFAYSALCVYGIFMLTLVANR